MNNEQIKMIEEAFEGKLSLDDVKVKSTVEQAIDLLDSGQLRVCEKQGGEWKTNAWVKQAILLFFRMSPMKTMQAGDLQFYDKIDLKKWTEKEGVRVVPHAVVRKGAYVEPGAILMPSYINIGAYVGSGTMVDTWATVGSCAQIGKNVHLSGGVGIGGVLEPIQANPVIIEDDVFVGSRCIVVEGVVVGQGAILGAGVTVTSSSRVIDVTEKEEKVFRGRIPANAVVIPGTSIKEFPAGSYSIPSALIIGYRNEKTEKKVSLTQALRDYSIAG